MSSPAVAWGELCFTETPEPTAIWGHRFELLPTGSNQDAGSAMHGVMGFRCKMTAEDQGVLVGDGSLVMCGMNGTKSADLKPFESYLCGSFVSVREAYG
jgi:hypothetical protein